MRKYIVKKHLLKFEAQLKMEKRIRDNSWEDDELLEEALRNYNSQGLQRREMLSFMTRD